MHDVHRRDRVDEVLVGRQAEGGGQHRLPGGEALEALAVLAQLRPGVELHLDQGVNCGVNSTAGRAKNFSGLTISRLRTFLRPG